MPMKTKWTLTRFVKTGRSSFQTWLPDVFIFPLSSPAWLRIDQDQPHLFIAQQRLLIGPPPRDDFKTAFPPLWTELTRMFFPVSRDLLCLRVVSPKLTLARLISAWRFTPGPPAANTATHSWLIWILLSAGGTAACWGRNVAWHLWKRSWGSKGWVPTKANKYICILRYITAAAFDLGLFMQERAPSVWGQIIAC